MSRKKKMINIQVQAIFAQCFYCGNALYDEVTESALLEVCNGPEEYKCPCGRVNLVPKWLQYASEHKAIMCDKAVEEEMAKGR